jgi:hypothetical protein
LALPKDAFYQADKPNYLQQGDVLIGVPLLFLPADPELLIIREQSSRRHIDQIHSGAVEIVRELALGSDAFDDRHEWVAVSAARSMAVLMTATCDIVDADQLWVCLSYEVEGSGLDEGNMRAGKYTNLFWMPEHEHFSRIYLDLSDVRSVSSKAVDLDNRLAALTREAQYELVERFIRSFGRKWGFEAGDGVPPSGKYETGNFRCARCVEHDIPIREIKPQKQFPPCEACEKIGKAAQWYPLRKHRRY